MRNISQIVKSLRRAGGVLENNSRSFSELTDVQIANGVPPVRSGRKATIFAPAKTAMQSGSSQTVEGGAPAWRVALEMEGKWVNPLMGWTSTADHLETVSRQMYFPSKEAAVAFAEKNSLDYEIEEPAIVPRHRPKRYPGYGANFDHNRLPGGKPIGGLRSELGKNK